MLETFATGDFNAFFFEPIEFDGRIVSILLLLALTAALPRGGEIEPRCFEKRPNSLKPLLATGRGSPWQQHPVCPAVIPLGI